MLHDGLGKRPKEQQQLHLAHDQLWELNEAEGAAEAVADPLVPTLGAWVKRLFCCFCSVQVVKHAHQ